MLGGLSDSDLHALIRTLLGVQATLVAASVAVLLYLLTRWREAHAAAQRAQKTPSTPEQRHEAIMQDKNLTRRGLRAKTFVLYVPLVTVFESLAYFFGWVEPRSLALGILGFYLIQILYLNWVSGPPSTRVSLAVNFEVNMED